MLILSYISGFGGRSHSCDTRCHARVWLPVFQSSPESYASHVPVLQDGIPGCCSRTSWDIADHA